jgi:hypothetical protein
MDPHYFQLPVAGEVAVLRERVYCYELYHQLRIALPHNFEYKLNGEVDKSGHPLFRRHMKALKPDFIVHQPGHMNRNLAVIEVKSTATSSRELRDDLKTLKNFLDRARYHRGIMLIYGSGRPDLPRRLVKELQLASDNRVVKMWHKAPRVKPIIIHIS